MRVDRFKDCFLHSHKTDSNYKYEIDYLCLGKRSDKIFIRIYNKTKEVIEQGYKSFFFYIWFFNGLISRYDLYIYEECYKNKSWKYVDIARLNFYLEYGYDDSFKDEIKDLIDCDVPDYDTIKKLADLLTPNINYIYNVEFQTMRKHMKNYILYDIFGNSKKYDNSIVRIYDLLDSQKMIIDYLTFSVFRLVDYDPLIHKNKSRCEMVSFWKQLRNVKLIDCNIKSGKLKLVRDYSSNLDKNVVKKRVINSISMFSLYNDYLNDNVLIDDVFDFMNSLNDNDIHRAYKYKRSKSIKFSYFNDEGSD